MRPFFCRFGIAVLFFLLHLDVLAQSTFVKKIYINRENENLKINTIAKDADGLFWIGTADGLYSFDGSESVQYSFLKKHDENNITAVFADDSKQIWVGCKNGKIGKLFNKELEFLKGYQAYPKKAITSISQDKSGTIWFATSGDGLYYLQKNSLKKVETGRENLIEFAYCSLTGADGKTYVGTDNGIAVLGFNAGKLKLDYLNQEGGLLDQVVRFMANDHNGNIWIGMQDKGICRYDLQSHSFYYPPEMNNWNLGQINTLTIDKTGIWIGTEENGLIFYSTKESKPLQVHKKYNNIEFKRIAKSSLDIENNVWFISNNALFQSFGNHLLFLSNVKSEKIEKVHALLSDNQKNIWFSNENGLFRTNLYDSLHSKFKKIELPYSSKIDVISMYEDPAGYIWAGTYNQGVYRINSITGIANKIQLSPTINAVGVISIGGYDNKIWLATLAGLFKIVLPDNLFVDKIYPRVEQDLPTKKHERDYVYSIFADSKKRIWLGTDGKGLACLEGNQEKTFGKLQGLKSDIVYSVSEDEKGNIWLNTLNAGIYKYDGKVFQNYSIKDGLRNINLSSLICDGRGSVYTVHKQGVDILDIKTGKFLYYGYEFGFSEMNLDLNSVAKDRLGNIWMGAERAIVRLFNDANHFSSKPKTILKNPILYADTIVNTSFPVFSSDENNISFDFYSIWYSNPRRIRFQYMLQGYNKDWIITKDNKLVFPNLPHGKYVFKVRSSITNNFKNASEASFSFTIKRPWWQSWWALGILVFLVLASSYLAIKLRLNSVRNLERLEKEKIGFQFETLKNQVNPHFLFNSFNTLIGMIEEDKELAVEYVEKLSDFFRNIVTYRDYDTITLKKELELASIYFFLQKKRYGKNLILKIDVAEDCLDYEVPPMVLQLLIENAVKHNAISSEAPLQISIIADHTPNRLFIANTINKRREKEPGTGTGLQNIVNRYKLLTKQEVTIDHNQKEFIVSIPLI